MSHARLKLPRNICPDTTICRQTAKSGPGLLLDIAQSMHCKLTCGQAMETTLLHTTMNCSDQTYNNNYLHRHMHNIHSCNYLLQSQGLKGPWSRNGMKQNQIQCTKCIDLFYSSPYSHLSYLIVDIFQVILPHSNVVGYGLYYISQVWSSKMLYMPPAHTMFQPTEFYTLWLPSFCIA